MPMRIVQGEQKKSFEIARNLLGMGLSPDAVAQATGLSLDELATKLFKNDL